LRKFASFGARTFSSMTACGLPQPRQQIAAILDQCRETPSFIDRLRSEASVTIFPVALPFRRTTAGRAAMHSATALAGDLWGSAWRACSGSSAALVAHGVVFHFSLPPGWFTAPTMAWPPSFTFTC
jgi:hypothetical protein